MTTEIIHQECPLCLSQVQVIDGRFVKHEVKPRYDKAFECVASGMKTRHISVASEGVFERIASNHADDFKPRFGREG